MKTYSHRFLLLVYQDNLTTYHWRDHEEKELLFTENKNDFAALALIIKCHIDSYRQ